METALDPDLPICDPHHHLWNRGDSRYLMEELLADTASGHRIEATVFVECGFGYRPDGPVGFRPVGETEFVVATDPAGFIAGIVGFADLCAPDVADVLAAHLDAGAGRFRGIRYKIARDPSPLLPVSSNRLDGGPLGEDQAFLAGLAACGRAGLSVDTWAYYTQLQELADVASAQPDVTIVVDHLGGPVRLGPYGDRRDEVLEIWRKRVSELAQHENIVMKLGGIGMPVFGETWHHFPERTTSAQIAAARGPEIMWCIEAFGPDRCMFESNFPVDKHSCSYVVLWNAFKQVTADLSASEKAALFRDTARRVYRITDKACAATAVHLRQRCRAARHLPPGDSLGYRARSVYGRVLPHLGLPATCDAGCLGRSVVVYYLLSKLRCFIGCGLPLLPGWTSSLRFGGFMSERVLAVGFILSQEQFPSGELLDLGVEAEAAGFDSIWVSDHFHPWQDNQGHAGHAWVTLAALTQRTSRIELGTGVTCPTYRFRPADVAHAFASLSGLAPGRIFLGVGTGEALNEIPSGGGWGPYKERAARLEEAVRLIRRLWSEDWVSSDGQYYPLTNANLYDKPPAPIPIYIAGTGPRSASLAGRAGDGWITGDGTLLRPDRHAARAAFLDGWKVGPSDRGTPRILIEQYTVVGNAALAAEAARFWQFMPVARDLLAEPDPRAIQRYAERHATPEDAASRMLVSPDPADHIERLRALQAAGATHVFLHAPQADQRSVIAFYRSSVLPAL